VTPKSASFEKVQPPAMLFRLGRDPLGHWVVEDVHRRCGGVFRDRVQALRFMRDEGGDAAVAILTADAPRSRAAPAQPRPS